MHLIKASHKGRNNEDECDDCTNKCTQIRAICVKGTKDRWSGGRQAAGLPSWCAASDCTLTIQGTGYYLTVARDGLRVCFTIVANCC
ncbi:unnamed protein product [Colias eurytheme]|nr:unnamed protein product [Colias eurytheme]